MKIRTRFAPSPSGFLHLGGVRTALFSWAFARKFRGEFVLRIEDTDKERTSEEAIKSILDGMNWLGLTYDEGPFFQSNRLKRYNEVINHLISEDKAYYCFSTQEELKKTREIQKALGQKPKYDGFWRPEKDKILPPYPNVKPVVRFKNPSDGVVSWNDAVKGKISIRNNEMDDLIIVRADGTPTYNLCVVVDDWDMNITHVIRGDDHINNTPRQINILRSIGVKPPTYAHLPLILGSNGEKLSKRYGSISIMKYADMGFLPESLINYLARLGWSHGNDEIFSAKDFCSWFSLDKLTKSSARFDFEKLLFINNHYIKRTDSKKLLTLVRPLLIEKGAEFKSNPNLEDVIFLLKDRVKTIHELVDSAIIFYLEPNLSENILSEHISEKSKKAIKAFIKNVKSINWNKDSIENLVNKILFEEQIKMHELAKPLRLLITGHFSTPSLINMLALFKKEVVLSRLSKYF